mmetsp:Transcript_36818/g.54833  ORF Transcript_36818/g.54833 Transcript_36818/m.54833 type:complete len:166 (-) Transcript_36818:192-689(-)
MIKNLLMLCTCITAHGVMARSSNLRPADELQNQRRVNTIIVQAFEPCGYPGEVCEDGTACSEPYDMGQLCLPGLPDENDRSGQPYECPTIDKLCSHEIPVAYPVGCDCAGDGPSVQGSPGDRIYRRKSPHMDVYWCAVEDGEICKFETDCKSTSTCGPGKTCTPK